MKSLAYIVALAIGLAVVLYGSSSNLAAADGRGLTGTAGRGSNSNSNSNKETETIFSARANSVNRDIEPTKASKSDGKIDPISEDNFGDEQQAISEDSSPTIDTTKRPLFSYSGFSSRILKGFGLGGGKLG